MSYSLRRLRQKSWLDAIPSIIDVFAIGTQTLRSIDRATISGIQFALVAPNCQRMNLFRLIGAMGNVLKMPLRQGARGTDTAISAAERDLEGGK